MSLLYTKLAVGVEWSGEGLTLVALGRRWRQLVVLDRLRLETPRGDQAPRQVAEFLDRNRIREAAVTACLPRQDLLVRFLDLPVEAEPKLRQVVGYQIDALHPYAGGEVYWDCAVVAREPRTRHIRVMVVLAEKSRVDARHQLLAGLGLRVDSLTLAAACLTAMVGGLVPAAALVACGRETELELVALDQGNLSATRELPAEPETNAPERLERELHALRASLSGSASAPLPVFACGSVPAVFSDLVREAAPLPTPAMRSAGGEEVDAGALAAAYVGLSRRAGPAINLLPALLRVRPARWVRVPVYALAATAIVLAAGVLAHGWVATALYARALDRQITRLEPQAATASRQSQEARELMARVAKREGIREQTWVKLRILQELARLLPDGTWVQELEVSESTVTVNGYSDRAAELVQLLENSSLFEQVEFTAPITRDAQNQEIIRLRMKLEAAGRG